MKIILKTNYKGILPLLGRYSNANLRIFMPHYCFINLFLPLGRAQLPRDIVDDDDLFICKFNIRVLSRMTALVEGNLDYEGYKQCVLTGRRY